MAGGPLIGRVFQPLLEFLQVIEDYPGQRAAGRAGAVAGSFMAAMAMPGRSRFKSLYCFNRQPFFSEHAAPW